LAAANIPEADAAVSWYGVPPLDYVNAQAIKAPVLGHFATEDFAFPRAQVEDLEKKFKEANVKYEFHWYNAKHAFANEKNTNPQAPILYNAEAAKLGWQRTLDFLRKNLK
jgi:carboxymethylenebutenolidase